MARGGIAAGVRRGDPDTSDAYDITPAREMPTLDAQVLEALLENNSLLRRVVAGLEALLETELPDPGE